MTEIRTATTLEAKRTEIRNTIAHYERLLVQARSDLAHITACIRLFDVAGEDRRTIPPYADLHRIFKYRELGSLCHQSLAKNGPQDTTELAAFVMNVKGLDEGDRAMRKAIAYRVVQTLKAQQKRGTIGTTGMRNNRRVWALPVKGS
jgi:hypothetical protein